MRSAEVLLAGLIATRSTKHDAFSAQVGAGGPTQLDFSTLAEKWALDAWTDFEPGDTQPHLESLKRRGVATATDDIHSLSEAGHAELLETVRKYLREPKNLTQFNIGLALKSLLPAGEFESCLRAFSGRLAESIAGNSRKAAEMNGTPFGDLMSLLLAQLQVTKIWLEARLSK